MLKVAILALLFVGLAKADRDSRGNVAFQVCDSAELAAVIRFGVTDCPDGSSECSFTVGNTYTFEVDVEVLAGHPVDALSLPFKVTVSFLGIPITLAEGDGCEYTQCPVQPGTIVTVSLTRDIPDSLPSINGLTATARFWAHEEGTAENASACASIPVSIVRP